MPASRSRTERWRDSLWKIYERGGGLEFALSTDDAQADPVKDLVWRVRMLGLTEDEIRVELPGTLGRSFRIEEGSELVGIMSVGQNRWMFRTHVLGTVEMNGRSGPVRALRLEMPERVERCQRRTFNRVSDAQINLPTVDAWVLRDPRSAIPAEVASRVRLLDAHDSDISGIARIGPEDAMLPDVGAQFAGKLANIGGGGVGLLVDSADAAALEGGTVFWLRVDLSPVLPAPLALTARLAHTHVDSQQRVYAGMAFEFAHHPSHQQFIVDQIGWYLSSLQRRAAA
ncbi:MAG: hypothetical protein DHS20C14_13560 [Phycisphaeraceae bacterium]|nr:MAG: hypothetical protein DHS20C14_13560 [Phycisphaeraceae bacterium]